MNIHSSTSQQLLPTARDPTSRALLPTMALALTGGNSEIEDSDSEQRLSPATTTTVARMTPTGTSHNNHHHHHATSSSPLSLMSGNNVTSKTVQQLYKTFEQEQSPRHQRKRLRSDAEDDGDDEGDQEEEELENESGAHNSNNGSDGFSDDEVNKSPKQATLNFKKRFPNGKRYRYPNGHNTEDLNNQHDNEMEEDIEENEEEMVTIERVHKSSHQQSRPQQKFGNGSGNIATARGGNSSSHNNEHKDRSKRSTMDDVLKRLTSKAKEASEYGLRASDEDEDKLNGKAVNLDATLSMFPFDLAALSNITGGNAAAASASNGGGNVEETHQQLTTLIEQLQMLRQKLVNQPAAPQQTPTLVSRTLKAAL